MTTFEVIENLQSADVEPEIVKLINDFLDGCDLVKFAKYKPTEDEHAATMNKAFDIVEKTKLIYAKPEQEALKPEEQPEQVDAEENKAVVENLEEHN
jgi:hypothetical protein